MTHSYLLYVDILTFKNQASLGFLLLVITNGMKKGLTAYCVNSENYI